MKLLPFVCATLVGMSACGDGDVNVTVHQDSTVAASPVAPAPAAPVAETITVPASPAPSSARVVSEEGFGAIQIGMRAADAERALAPVERYGAVEPTESCRYLNPTGEPHGVQFMVFDGAIVRYDVGPLDGPAQVPTADLPRTAAGVGVGSTEAEVRAAYGARMTTEPHHYTDGKYLVVVPADTSRRIIFETDNKGVVTELRAGKQPQVGWVEGCS